MNLRLFCALQVPQSVQDELVKTIPALKGAMSTTSTSWVKPGNFHLTLSFLGDVEQSRIERLAEGLQTACQEMSGFEMVCRGLGCFPTLNRPRVIWAGCYSKSNELAQLQDRVATACAPFAQRAEKGNFKGHITLGRIRSGDKRSGATPSRDQLAREIERHREIEFGRWDVHSMELLQSDLSEGAPRYSVLHRFPLL